MMSARPQAGFVEHGDWQPPESRDWSSQSCAKPIRRSAAFMVFSLIGRFSVVAYRREQQLAAASLLVESRAG
jgi:hypothetical protein